MYPHLASAYAMSNDTSTRRHPVIEGLTVDESTDRKKVIYDVLYSTVLTAIRHAANYTRHPAPYWPPATSRTVAINKETPLDQSEPGSYSHPDPI